MTNFENPSLPSPEDVYQSNSEAFSVFGGVMDRLIQTMPEVAASQEIIHQGAASLIEDFELKPSLFEDPGRSIVFASLAKKYGDLMHSDNGDEREYDFIGSALVLLARNHSDKLGSEQEDDPEASLSETYKLSVYDKYTDKELTEKLRVAIDNGMLDAVKERLQITSENEQPYEVRVLNVASSDLDFLGLSAPKLEDTELNTEQGLREILDKLKEHGDLVEQINAFKKGCIQRGANFAKERGHDGLTAPAWVTTIAGRRFLCVNMPLAEKLIDPELTQNASYYSQDYRARDFATLEHEYTHSQGGLNVDNGISFGIGLEELRAEYFSGSMQGYQDMKGLFLDIFVITGYHPDELFEQSPIGGSAEEHYAKLADIVGLDNLTEVLLSVPMAYLSDQPDKYTRKAFESFGGYDGLLSRLLHRQYEAGKEGEIEDRIERRVSILQSIDGDASWVLNHRRKFGLNIVTDLIEARYNQVAGQPEQS